MIESTNADNEAYELYFAEVPIPYGGETTDATISLDNTGLVTNIADGDIDMSKVNIGDSIKFNYQGRIYRIDNVTSNKLTLSFENKLATPVITDAPFQIFRKPIRSKRAPGK